MTRVQHGGKQFDTIHEARARAAEVRAGIHDIEIRPRFRGSLPGLLGMPDPHQFLDGAIDGVAARYHNHHVGLSLFHIVPRRVL